MNQEAKKVTIYRKTVANDLMSERSVIIVTIPPYGVSFDNQEFEVVTQTVRPDCLNGIRKYLKQERNNVEDDGRRNAPEKIPNDNSELENLFGKIEDTLGTLGLDKNQSEVSLLTTLCIRLGRQVEEKHRRVEHYGEIERAYISNNALRADCFERNEHIRKIKVEAEKWQHFAQQVAFNGKDGAFWKLPRRKQAEQVLKRLKAEEITLKLGTVENFYVD